MPPVLVTEGARGAQQPSESREQPVEGEQKGSEPAKPSQRELPSWLYLQPTAQPKTPGPSAAMPPLPPTELPAEEERSKYLRGIRGVLPSADAWLSSSQKLEIGKPTPVSKEVAEIKPEPRSGCLPLGVVIVLGITGLILLLAC